MAEWLGKKQWDAGGADVAYSFPPGMFASS
jgi:hypothetical protein